MNAQDKTTAMRWNALLSKTLVFNEDLTLRSVSPLTDDGDVGGRDALYGNENDLSGLALGTLMAQEDLECLSDIQSDSEFSSSPTSQYPSQSFPPPAPQPRLTVSPCVRVSCLQVECSSKVPARLIPAAANRTQSLSTPWSRVSVQKMHLTALPHGTLAW